MYYLLQQYKKHWILNTLHILSLLFFVVPWFLFSLHYLWNFVSLLLLSGVYLTRAIKSEGNIYQKFLDWYIVILLFLSILSYVAIIGNSPYAALGSVFIVFLSILVFSLINNLISLTKSNKLWVLILSYIVASFATIALFSFIFMLLSFSPGNEIKWVNIQPETSVQGTWNLTYFSATVFYASTFGDILPFGVSRLVSIIELMFSFVLHSMVISYAINNIKYKLEDNNE